MEDRFIHRGSAAPFGGQVTRPFSEVLDIQAATALPGSGGYGSARAEAFRYREIVSFDAAYSQVTGNRDAEGSHETLVLAVVEGLNILDMVTADRIVARLTSSQPADTKPDAELPMRPAGSYFVNLRIAGVPVDPRPHDVLVETTRKSDLESDKRLAELYDPRTGENVTRSKDHRRLFVSLFDHMCLEPLRPSAQCRGGCRIEIPDFGVVTLGEYVVAGDARRLTMLRVDMGSPVAGRFTAGAVEGDGHPI